MYRRCRRPEDAAADQSHPNRHHELGRDAGDERLRESRECDRRDRGGEPGEPGLERRVAEHLLHVERADEDEGEEACAKQQRDCVRAGDSREPENTHRQQGSLDARLDHEERELEHGGNR